MMEAINFTASAFYLAVSMAIFRSIWKKNLFWLYFISIEYFYILGLGIYPMALALGIAVEPRYLTNSSVELLVPLHIFSYSLGAVVGYYILPRDASIRLASFVKKLDIDPRKAYRTIFVIFAASAVAYIAAVGLREALLGASYARSGDFDFFESGNKYAFLKRPMMVGLLGSAYAYYFIPRKRSVWYLAASIVIGIVIYFTTVSRYALFQSILIPFGFYTIYKMRSRGIGKFYSVLFLCAGVLFSIGVLLYGKTFVSQLGNYFFMTGTLDLDATDTSGALDQFSHLYYSIDAGIRYFFSYGPTLFKDVITAPFGIFPSSFFASAGLESISYQLQSPESSFSCVNTAMIAGSYGECYLPPYFTGASAYMLPIGGGFIFGLVRFYCYAIVCRAWQILDGSISARQIPTVIVIFMFFEQVMLFIPATISMVSFMLIISIFLIKIGIVRYRG